MRNVLKYTWLMLAILALLSLAACGDDDDDNNTGTNPEPEADAWVGRWLSAGDDVAEILVNFANNDSIYVTFNENNTVVLETHVPGEAWVTTNGTYLVTESATGDVHSIEVSYPTYDQEGIIQVFEAAVDSFWLEAVATTIGAPIPTPESGFGNNGYGTTNIQVYRRVN